MKIKVAAQVDIGAKATNDDRALIADRILDMEAYETVVELPAVAVVCDGCGGYAGGGVAASTVLEFISYETPESLLEPEYLAQVLENCRQQVEEKKVEMPQYEAMCTTVAGCVFSEESIVFFHAGDSRVYRCDRWGLTKITVDHSAVQSMVDMGQITEEEALSSPRRNVINRCIGVECLPPEIKVANTPIYPNEKYLLCSDGLWDCVSEAETVEILGGDMTLGEMAEALIQKALDNGTDDNVSVCIIEIQEEAEEVEETDPTVF